MKRPIKIAPSILAADFANLGAEVKAICASGADYIHIDVMDGHFVPNLTFGADVVKAIAPYADKPLDVHLMVAPVDPHIEAFAEAGAHIISFHPEAGAHPHRTIQAIKNAGCKIGLVLNPGTPLVAIADLLGDIDLLLIMSVNPGFGGQSFIASQTEKIAAARALIDKGSYAVELEVDGGITPETAPLAIAAGADILVAGTASFRGGRDCYADNIAALRGAKGRA